MQASLSPAAAAFDAIAPVFDARFGEWRSVAAQRGAVRMALARTFAPGTHVLEIGGGTGEDALWLARHGWRVTLTDASPAMVAVAARKVANEPGITTEVVGAENLAEWATERANAGKEQFAGAFSNFAALNCVADLSVVARGMARLLPAGASAMIVLFGPFPPGEVITQMVRGEPRMAVRRWRRHQAPARLGGREFTVRYHRPAYVRAAFAPWFQLAGRRGIGVFVPPSAAEPWISRYPRLLNVLSTLDGLVARPLAMLGDHVLYHFVRTDAIV